MMPEAFCLCMPYIFRTFAAEKQSSMLIGITGGIGSGKSTIAAELMRRGYGVYNTDDEAKRIIVTNPMVRSQIELLFGSEVYDGDRYCTDRVSHIVFRNPSLLERLNAIVHPAVAYDLKQWYHHQQELNTAASHLCFVECAILFESGLNQYCDHVVAVVAPETVRIERTLQRDYHPTHTEQSASGQNIEKDKEKVAYSQADREAVRARIHAQMSDAERSARADMVLNNDGTSSIPALVDQLLTQIPPKQ